MRAALVTVLVLTVLTVPAVARAATLSVARPCYVATVREGEDGRLQQTSELVALAGTGFAPGGPVELTFDGEHVGTAQADAQGAFAQRLPAPFASRGEQPFEIFATDAAGTEARTISRVSALAVAIAPKQTRATGRVSFTARGFNAAARNHLASGPMARTALVTGANRGIGLATATALGRAGLRVVATSRRDHERLAVELREQGVDAIGAELDVADATSVERCAQALARDGVDVDVLVCNAAVLLDRGGVLDTDDELVRATLEVNLLGPWRCARAFLPAMIERGYGRVVIVSSGAGQVSETSTYAPAYSISKAAVNLLARKLAIAAGTRGDVKVNAVDPGWVASDMGGAGAPRTLEQGADTIVWLATLGRDGPTNGFFYERRPTAW